MGGDAIGVEKERAVKGTPVHSPQQLSRRRSTCKCPETGKYLICTKIVITVIAVIASILGLTVYLALC